MISVTVRPNFDRKPPDDCQRPLPRAASLTRQLLARVEAQADLWLQEDLIDIDTHRSGGLLQLSFPDRSQIVINTQPPLHEVWLAAKGGGFHYRWSGAAWVDTRDGREFFEVLSEHASRQGGRPLRFSA